MKKTFLEQQKERWETLVARGKKAGIAKDLISVLEYFDAAYKISRHFPKKDPIRRQSAYYLGYAKFAIKEKTKAIEYFEEYLNHPDSVNQSSEEICQVQIWLGDCYYPDDKDKAEEHFRKALEIMQKLGLPTLEVDTMIGTIRMFDNDFSAAIPFLQSAYEVQKTNDKDAAQLLAFQLASAYKQLGDSVGETKWQKENLKYRIPQTSFSSEERDIEIRADVPEGWGKDSLSHFLEASQQNELGSYVVLNNKYRQLQSIYERFLENRRNLILSVTPILNSRYADVEFDELKLQPKEWLELYFYLRTQAAFAGAAKLALSAQIPEMYMLLRGVIENAIYAFYVWKNPDKKHVWLARDKNPQAKRAAKNEFQASNIFSAIDSVDSNLKSDVEKLYNDTIDMGAHPNVKTFTDHAVQENEEGVLTLAVTTLNAGQLDSALDDVAATGDVVFRLFKAMYPDLID